MNIQLYQSYYQLSDFARNELHQRFKDSPVALSLLQFISKCKQVDFKNQDVVKFIYKSELDSNNYSKLENRYFKLRKKIVDEINKIDKGSPDELPLEEQTFLNCKKLVFTNQKETAFQQLTQLEKECWKKNIFELLPGIIDQIIFINQSFNRLEKDPSIYERYQLAIRLQQDLWTMIMTTRKIYELNYKTGLKSAHDELELLESLSSKNKDYPRFALCYHHTNIYYRLSSTNFSHEFESISFHHDTFSNLSKTYPLIPHVSFRANYSQYQNFHFKNISAFYLFNKLEFEQTHELMFDLFKMVTNSNTIYSIFNSESIYFNTFQAQLATYRFKEAEQTVALYIDFLKKNDLHDKIQQAHVMNIMARSEQSGISRVDYDYYFEKLDVYIRFVRKNINIQIPSGSALLLKAKLYLLQKEFTKAQEVFKKEEVKKYLNELQIFDQIDSFFSNKSLLNLNSTEINQFKNLFRKPDHLIKPEALIQLNWFYRFVTKAL